MAEVIVYCFSCKKPNSFSDTVGFRAECPSCRNDLHVCKTCDFYDTSSYNECRETSADPIKEKERANFCDFYRPSSKNNNTVDKQAALKSAADALFKKK